MTVQHQLEVYIENPCQFLRQLSKKSDARDRVQPPLKTHILRVGVVYLTWTSLRMREAWL